MTYRLSGRNTVKPRIVAVKTVFAALAISLLAVAPAIASEASSVLRSSTKPATVQMAAVVNVAPAPVAQDVQAKKVRVILASPYGN